MGNSCRPVLLWNRTKEECQINYYFDSDKETYLISLGPGDQARLDKQAPLVTVNVIESSEDNGKKVAVATYTVQTNCNHWLHNNDSTHWSDLEIVKKCEGKHFDIRRSCISRCGLNHYADHFKQRSHKRDAFLKEDHFCDYYRFYSQVYNSSPFAIKMLVSDSLGRNTTQVVEPGESGFVATPKGRNKVQLIDFTPASNLVAAQEEDAKPMEMDVNPWYSKELMTANRSTLIAKQTGNHLTLVQGYLRFCDSCFEYYPKELLGNMSYDHAKEYKKQCCKCP